MTAIANFTGFARGSIERRAKRWGLGKDVDPKAVLALKPMDDQHVRKISLEEARTDLAVEDARLKRLNADKLEGKLADVEEVIGAVTELFDGISAIVRSSPLSDDRKEDIFGLLRDYGRQWGERQS